MAQEVTPLSSRLRELGEGATPGPYSVDVRSGVMYLHSGERADCGSSYEGRTIALIEGRPVAEPHPHWEIANAAQRERDLRLLADLRNNLPRLVAACALAEALDAHVAAMEVPSDGHMVGRVIETHGKTMTALAEYRAASAEGR